VVRIGVLETNLESNASRIQGLYDADYEPKYWVEKKNYATEAFVNGAVVSGSAIGVLIDLALTGYAPTPQLGATNQTISDLTDAVHSGFDAKVTIPDDWNAFSTPVGLKTYVETKVGTGIVREPDDWSSYPSGNFGGLPPNLNTYTEGKVNDFKAGGSSYLKLRDASANASGNRIGSNGHTKNRVPENHGSPSVWCRCLCRLEAYHQ
jgi:hypothetical protein